MSDLVPLRCDVKINITGTADLQRNIRLLCKEYIDIFSPTVSEESARIPPLSMIVDSDKWKDKQNRLSPRFLTRDKDADPRKQVALLETLGVIEKSKGSEYSQVHLVRKPDQTPSLAITPFYLYLLEITPIGARSPVLPHFTFFTPLYLFTPLDLSYPFLP